MYFIVYVLVESRLVVRTGPATSLEFAIDLTVGHPTVNQSTWLHFASKAEVAVGSFICK